MLFQCWIHLAHTGKSRWLPPASTGFRLPSRLEELFDPAADGLLHGGKMSFEEMVSVLDKHQFFGPGQQLVDALQAILRTELVMRAAHKQLGLGTAFEKIEIVSAALGGHRSTQRDQSLDAIIRAGSMQPGRCPKRKSAEQNW